MPGHQAAGAWVAEVLRAQAEQIGGQGRGAGVAVTEERLDQARTVAVISHRLWQTRFDGAADVVGRTVRLNGRPFTIIGVAAQDFGGSALGEQQLWVPITAYPDGEDLRRENARVRCAGLTDGKRTDRNARRHLHNRQQAVLTGECARLDRNAQR